MSDQLVLTDEGREHVLPFLRELRVSMGRDLTAEELVPWLNGWLCAEKYAAHVCLTGQPFRWLREMLVDGKIVASE